MVLNNIRKRCSELGISVSEACRRAEVSRDTVNDWTENRKPSADNLLKMAKALEIDPEELLREED